MSGCPSTGVYLKRSGSLGCNFDTSVTPTWRIRTLTCLLREVFSLFFKVAKKSSVAWLAYSPSPLFVCVTESKLQSHRRGIDVWQCLTSGFCQKRSMRRRWARRGWAWRWDVPAALRSPSQSSACGAWPGCASGNEFSPVNILPVQQWVQNLSKDFLEWEGEPSLPPHRLCPLSGFRPCI